MIDPRVVDTSFLQTTSRNARFVNRLRDLCDQLVVELSWSCRDFLSTKRLSDEEDGSIYLYFGRTELKKHAGHPMQMTKPRFDSVYSHRCNCS